jgi:hypothetical protein
MGFGRLSVVALLATACAAATAPMTRRQRLDPKSAYIYGRFTLDTKDGLSVLGTEHVTFAIRCRDGQTYNLLFRPEQPLQILQLPATSCQIEDVVADSGAADPQVVAVAFAFGGVVGAAIADAASDAGDRRMASARLLNNELLDPGGVYYVGDFHMKATDNRKLGDRHNDWTAIVRDNYAATTAEMKKTFVNFAKRPTENRISR